MTRPRPAGAGHIARCLARVAPALVVLACAAPAAAQSSVEFLPRTSFLLSAEHLSSEEPRLVWDTNFGGAIDFVDYGVGRATFLANYQAVLGTDVRIFDPNQGNYTIEGSTSARIPGVEVAAVFHHTSRHLSDRLKGFPVDWNTLGVRMDTSLVARTNRMNARVDIRRVLVRSYVDYQWEVDAEVHNVHTIRGGVAAISGAGVRLLGVDGSQNRGNQTGVRGEGGVRFEGPAGAVELYVSAERRIDPFPTEFGVESFLGAGFRFLSR